MFLSDQCMYWCTSLCEFVIYSVLQLSQSSPQSLQTLISLHTDLRPVPGVSRAAQGWVNLQQERGEILQHGECYGVIYCIIIDQRDHVDWPVGGGGDLQCVRAAPAQCFSSLAQWSPAPALQSALAPVSLLLSAAPPSSPAVQSDISQWSGWDQWRAPHGLLSPSLCFSAQPGQSTNY